MSRLVALLRGINVGKAKRIAMADLRQVVEGLGFTGVATLLNSGNVVFSGRGAAAAIAGRLEEAIVDGLGVSSRVVVLTAAELAASVATNPFGKAASDPARLLVAVPLIATDIRKLAPLAVQDWGIERIALGPRVASVWCPRGSIDSPLLKATGKVLEGAVTTRNWATMTRLDALLRGGA